MKPLSSALAAAGLAAALAWAASLGVIAVAAPAAPPAAPAAAAAAPRGAPAADTTGAEERADGIVAVVGGEPVFQSEVDEQLYLFLMQSGTRPDSATAAGLRQEILAKIVDEKLIVQEAKRKQVTVPDAELDAQVNQAITEAKERVGGEQAFAGELRKEGISEGELRERYRGEIRRQMLANQLLRRELNLKLEVSPAEAEAYFKANPKEFPTKPAEIRVALVLIPIEPDPQSRAAARKRADETLARVQKGESFTRVAQEVSEDPATRASGGDLGFFARGQLDSAFTAVAFALRPGQLSGVVETPFGYHIIRVEETDSTRAEVHARHILIRVPVTETDEKRAETQAQAVYAEAAKGLDFGALARKYSKFRGPQDPNGDIGFLPLSAFSPEFRAALEPLAIGDVTRPLKNPQGFHIFKLLDRRPERGYELEEIRPQLPELVRQMKLKQQYDTWVAGLRAKARVEYR
jgi:peptidyl-prolyl cis-trans isomerase SurA